MRRHKPNRRTFSCLVTQVPYTKLQRMRMKLIGLRSPITAALERWAPIRFAGYMQRPKNEEFDQSLWFGCGNQNASLEQPCPVSQTNRKAAEVLKDWSGISVFILLFTGQLKQFAYTRKGFKGEVYAKVVLSDTDKNSAEFAVVLENLRCGFNFGSTCLGDFVTGIFRLGGLIVYVITP